MSTDSEKLRQFRTQKNLSQAALAKELQVTQAAIAMIEKGTRLATANFKLAFAKRFGIDWDSQESNEPNTTKPTTNIVSIPFYTAKASAGTGVSLPDYEESEVMHFDRRWVQNVIGVNPDNATIIQAKGDSMLPLISDGDLLMVDISIKEPVKGQIFVVQDDKQLFVKRVSKEWDGKWILLSENKEYPDVIPSKEAVVIGKVVWNGSKETV